MEESLFNILSDMEVYWINHNIGAPKKSTKARQTHPSGLAEGERVVALLH